MKKFLVLFLSFVFSLSLFAQQLNINARTAGAGTNITVAFINRSNTTIDRFELTVQNDSIFGVNYFELGQLFYNYNGGSNNWLYQSGYSNNLFKVAAVGKPIAFINKEEIGSINFYINKSLDGIYGFPNMNFWDGKVNWSKNSGGLKILNFPMERYGDLNSNGKGDKKRDINDNKISFDIIGMVVSNDTLSVLNDLSGDGLATTNDTYLGLGQTVDSAFYRNWPIFQVYYHGSTAVSTPIVTTWKSISNGKWGLFSPETITNGDLLVVKENINSITLPSGSNMMFKKIDNKVYFVGAKGVVNSPIIVSDSPVQITGTLNNNRIIVVSNPTGVTENSNALKTFELNQNYPNPFNPSTTINYQIPTNGMVTLKVYDVTGKEVATLVNEQKQAGKYEVKFNAINLTSGTYIYKISSGSFIETKKMILMK